MPGKLHGDDDFVLTISDNDELPIDDSGSSSPDEDRPIYKKRKRDSEQRSKPVKKQRRVQSQPYLQSNTYNDLSSEEMTAQDEAIDPGFEFDLGTNEVPEIFDNIDAWMADTMAPPETRVKRGVDIDAIIARRAAKGSGKLKHNHEMNMDDGNNTEDKGLREAGDDQVDDEDEYEQEEEEEEEEEDAEDDILDLGNDELLSRDAFGGNVESEDEDAMEGDGSTSGQNKETGSDSESVASPTAHPEDIGSESSDDSTSQTSNDEEAAKRAAFFAPETKIDTKLTNSSSFQQFSLSRPILRALAALSFANPTPIQSHAIPVALQGIDIVGSAVTGSGKTAAFLLPILERLLYRPRKIPTTRVAILLPTRELAVQCYNVAVLLARFTDITFAQVVGGFSLREQEAILKKRPDVVIATPGRFIDHMRNSASFTVESIEILVLDEADRMLEDGFADELDEILRTIPKGRQTMLFSATMTESIDKLVRVGMNKPVRVSVDAKKSTVSGLVQEFVRLRPGREQMRLAVLAKLCTEVFTERTIVFFRQKKEAHRVRIVLGLLGLKAGELHGSMSQEQRIAAVTSFREGKITHLLATDLASRGLDIKNVMSVINYEAPQSHEIYLHRVGRTARAGRSGRSCTIAAETDRKIVKAAVKAARSQGAKIVSRVMANNEIDAVHQRVEALADEVEEIFREEKEEKAMAQAETQIMRGENIVKHQDEIMSRPKRTWFESEKEKRAAKERGKAELNNVSGVKFTGEKKKLSNKDKKRLDDRRERTEGRTFKKRKGDAEAVVKANQDKKKARKSSRSGNKSSETGGKSKARR